MGFIKLVQYRPMFRVLGDTMARSRLVKPEFFGDVTLSDVSRDARLLYIGLWQLMDRRGLMEYHPKLVKRDLFAYDDDVTAARVDGWVQELVMIGRLRLLPHNGKYYLHAPTMPVHQHFHHNEKENRLIPDSVLSQACLSRSPKEVPGLPQASIGQLPGETGACPTDTDTDPNTDTASASASDPAEEEKKETEAAGEKPEESRILPSPLTAAPVLEVLIRRQVPDEQLWIYLDDGAPADWLAVQVKKLDIEVPKVIPFNEYPFKAKLRFFLDVHWPKEKERLKKPPSAAPPPPARAVVKPCRYIGEFDGKPMCERNHLAGEVCVVKTLPPPPKPSGRELAAGRDQ